MKIDPSKQLSRLKTLLREVNDLQMILWVLEWDQSTYMPPAGGAARGQQMSTLAKIAHQKFTSPTIGKLLDALQPYAETLPYDSDDAALLRLVRRQYDRAVKVPAAFAAEMSNLNSTSYMAWAEARPKNDFATVRPLLEKKLEMSRRYADFFPGYQHIADPLISNSDYGMTAATIRPLFGELRRWLTPLVKAISDQPPPDDSFLYRHYPAREQLQFSETLTRQLGYDFGRGRQDETHHPFMTKFSSNDVRITTRVYEDNLSSALFSSLHEAGHALYEQGIAAQLEGLPLNNGTSAGIHESQSRLWENQVGRSRGFWQCHYPALQQTFGAQLGDVSVDQFYRAINKVQRSLIRTEADEVTYNLHVIIRFELELSMLEGNLAIADLPEAWRAAYQDSLGIASEDDRDGCMQDVHWFAGAIGGGFQGYTLGNIMAAQFYQAALQAHPEIPTQVMQGDCSTLHHWLRDNLYQHGSKFTTAELIKRATGGVLQLEPYQKYLSGKYGELYRGVATLP